MAPPDKRFHDSQGDLVKRLAGKACDLLSRQRRPSLGHIQAAVAGKTRQQGILEAERRGFAAGGDVFHVIRTKPETERELLLRPAGLPGQARQWAAHREFDIAQ